MAPINQSGEDGGFEALLKPIQDMTRNWDVDLVIHLEEYINYIRQICGENIPDMNFAQAAVLVQNSATIYSKKVDFLFITVMQLLDTISKKQNQGKENDNLETVEGGSDQQRGRRKRAVLSLDTEDFAPLHDICPDRVLSLSSEKEMQKAAERKKQTIVLNAAIKVKAKEKTSCNVYSNDAEIMAKKEEFRLTWRLCSAGTLHEEFVINNNRFKLLDPIEVSVMENGHVSGGEDDHHDYNDDVSQDNREEAMDLQPVDEPPPNIALDANRESHLAGLPEAKQVHDKLILDTEVAWQANKFEENLPKKPFKKRNVLKIPSDLEDENKRKRYIADFPPKSYTVTDLLFSQSLSKMKGYARSADFSHQFLVTLRQKRQLLLQHRKEYQGQMEKDAEKDQADDFHGFYGYQDSDDDNNDFEGFENDADDDRAPEVDIPLPDQLNILHVDANDNWKNDASTYDNEAMRTIHAFRSRKIDHDRMTDMARRVEEWHQKITPKLEAAEERSSFDIHEYGSKVIAAFPEGVGTVKTFQEIVNGQSREEVARYFLASLVLANQYNVEISETKPGDLNQDCMQLKLLSIERHHERMDDNIRNIQ